MKRKLLRSFFGLTLVMTGTLLPVPAQASIFQGETLDIGEDTSTPVSENYHVPFKFTGNLAKVTIKLGEGKLTHEEQLEYDEVRGRGVMAE